MLTQLQKEQLNTSFELCKNVRGKWSKSSFFFYDALLPENLTVEEIDSLSEGDIIYLLGMCSHLEVLRGRYYGEVQEMPSYEVFRLSNNPYFCGRLRRVMELNSSLKDKAFCIFKQAFYCNEPKESLVSGFANIIKFKNYPKENAYYINSSFQLGWGVGGYHTFLRQYCSALGLLRK